VVVTSVVVGDVVVVSAVVVGTVVVVVVVGAVDVVVCSVGFCFPGPTGTRWFARTSAIFAAIRTSYNRYLDFLSSAVASCLLDTCVVAPRSPTLPDTATLTSPATETPSRCSRIRRRMILWSVMEGISPLVSR